MAATDLGWLDAFRYVPNATPTIVNQTNQDSNYAIRRYCSEVSNALERNPSPTELDARLSGFEKGATKRDIAWQLTDEQARTLFLAPCTYCGARSRPTRVNGIDRVDNHGQYDPRNAVSCCSTCNTQKSRHALEEWLHHCGKVCLHAITHPNGISLPDGRVISMVLDTDKRSVVTTVSTPKQLTTNAFTHSRAPEGQFHQWYSI